MKLIVSKSFPDPPMYAKEKPFLIEEENKRLIEEYEDCQLLRLTKKGMEFINGR